MSTKDITLFVIDDGKQTTSYAQHMLKEAEGELYPELFAVFHDFCYGSLHECLAALRGLLSLGHSNIREVIASLPSYQRLPEDKQSFVQLIIGRLRG